ncbi:MAG: phosphate-starvation-inducible PsiE family protein, partial [Dolichospermum sp.]
MRKLIKDFLGLASDKNFMHIIEIVEIIVSKILSLLMIIVIFATLFDLATFVFKEILSPEESRFSQTLFTTFGLFLNVLIALEILENITAYLKKHVLQVEL